MSTPTPSPDSLLETLTHELRTPLHGMLGAAELLMEGEPRPDQEALIHALGVSAQHLLRLLDDVLDLSRMESGRLDLVLEPVHLRPLVEELCRVHATSAEAKGIELRWEVESTVPAWVESDATRLRQVLHNLLSNAVKFTLAGHVTMLVTSPAQARLQVEVRDTGPGIASEFVERVFTAYERGEDRTARSEGGTGLGLPIARRIALAMGGGLSLESEVGRGSQFTFEIPAAEHIGAAALSAEAANLEDRVRFDGKRVLIVDDNPVNALISTRMLSGAGANVLHVGSGADALECVTSEDLDLVLMDFHLPDMDGAEATAQIRSLGGKRGKVLVVAFSASTDESKLASILAAGADGFLPKPMRLDDLRQALADCFANG